MRFLWLAFMVILPSCTPSSTTTPQAQHETISAVPLWTKSDTRGLFTAKYRCDRFMCAVNNFRSAGKDGALMALKDYVGDDRWPGYPDAFILCRALFEGKWYPPVLGEPLPHAQENSKAFPLFPLAIVDDVPFLLITGYRLGGQGDRASRMLNGCQNRALVDHDFHYDKGKALSAAKRLVDMPEFRVLYEQEEDYRKMKQFVLQQAEPSSSSADDAKDSASLIREYKNSRDPVP